MFSLVIKFSIAFVVSFVILSIPFSSKPLFYHLTKVTGPIGGDIKKSISKSVNRSMTKSKELGTQLFTNSEPPKVFDDRIKSKQSSILKKRRQRLKENSHAHEELRHSDVEALDKIISH